MLKTGHFYFALTHKIIELTEKKKIKIAKLPKISVFSLIMQVIENKGKKEIRSKVK